MVSSNSLTLSLNVLAINLYWFEDWWMFFQPSIVEIRSLKIVLLFPMIKQSGFIHLFSLIQLPLLSSTWTNLYPPIWNWFSITTRTVLTLFTKEQQENVSKTKKSWKPLFEKNSRTFRRSNGNEWNFDWRMKLDDTVEGDPLLPNPSSEVQRARNFSAVLAGTDKIKITLRERCFFSFILFLVCELSFVYHTIFSRTWRRAWSIVSLLRAWPGLTALISTRINWINNRGVPETEMRALLTSSWSIKSEGSTSFSGLIDSIAISVSLAQKVERDSGTKWIGRITGVWKGSPCEQWE